LPGIPQCSRLDELATWFGLEWSRRPGPEVVFVEPVGDAVEMATQLAEEERVRAHLDRR
jgi:hypothetical protein